MEDFDKTLRKSFEVSYEGMREELELALEDYQTILAAYKKETQFTEEEANEFLPEVTETIKSISDGIEKAKDPKLREWFFEEGIKTLKALVTEEEFELMKKGQEISLRIQNGMEDHFTTFATFLLGVPTEHKKLH